MTLNVAKQTAYVAMLSPVMAVAKQTAYFVMLPATDTLTASFAGRIEVAGTLETGEASFELFLDIAARIELAGEVAVSGLIVDPPFRCAIAALEPVYACVPGAEVSWSRMIVDPAEACDEDDEDTGNDLFAYVSGDRLAYVDGDRLKYAA